MQMRMRRIVSGRRQSGPRSAGGYGRARELVTPTARSTYGPVTTAIPEHRRYLPGNLHSMPPVRSDSVENPIRRHCRGQGSITFTRTRLRW